MPLSGKDQSMKPRNVIILFLAAVMLLSTACGIRIVEKPQSSAPAISVQETPVPTAEPTETPAETHEPVAAPSASPAPTAEPSPEETMQPAGTAEYRRGSFTFDDITYERPDFEAVQEQIDAIREMLTDGSTAQEIRAAYDALDEAFYGISDAYTAASLFSAMDINDEYWSSEEEYVIQKNSELQVLATKLEIEIYESEFCDEVFYDWTEEDFAYLRIAEKLYDDEYVELNTRREEIVNAYWTAQTETTVRYNGGEYTLAELDSMNLSDNRYYALLNDYYANLNAVVGQLYLELISIEKQIAAKAGFDSFPEFSYAFEYERDYTVEDSQTLADAVRSYVVPEFNALYSGLSRAEYSGLMQAMNAEDQLTRRQSHIEEHVAEISPDMLEAYHYLIENRLSVITDSDTSQDGAYTTFFPALDVPFIYLHESGGYRDVMTFIHEFGHFYTDYLGGRDVSFYMPLDVQEICSQADEMLFLPRFGDFYPEDTYNGILKYQMIDALGVLIDGCLYDEFQQYVYTHEVETVEELNEIYRQISRTYGIDDDYYYVDLGYAWVDVLHNFEVPMYYISYATSVVPALEILKISISDREEAIRVYNEVVRSDPELSFSEVLGKVGLASPFDEQTIIDVVNAVVDLTGVGLPIN